MPNVLPGFEFEQSLVELEEEIGRLAKQAEKDPALSDNLRELRRKLADETEALYASLTPWQTVRVARHQNRPQTADYLSLVFDDFVELHGDRLFGDDRAMRTGFAKLGNQKVMVVGHQKGRTVKERSECYFGCAHPEGYRKALAKIKTRCQVQNPCDLSDRYTGRVPRRGGRGAGTIPGDRREHVCNVPHRNPDCLCRDR